ncbi:MAG: DUF4118 domain-containing protein, partial [Sulfuricella sp.]|nr:DUF4118 domain-containing protein [Sulfuricella sp.]
MTDPAPASPPPAGSEARTSAGILTIVLGYAVFAALWILLSDKVVEWLFDDPAWIILASTLKGWLFVGVTSLLLYGLLRRLVAGIGGKRVAIFEGRAALVAWPRWTIYAFAVAVSVAMLLVREGIAVALPDRPLLILFVFPIILSAVLGGFGPGLLATLVVSTGAAYFAMPPVHDFRFASVEDLFQWSILVANGLLISILAEVLHRSRRLAETALTESKEATRFARAIADNSNAVIFVKDLAGRYLFVNWLYETLFHVSAATIAGKTDSDLFPRDMADAFVEN